MTLRFTECVSFWNLRFYQSEDMMLLLFCYYFELRRRCGMVELLSKELLWHAINLRYQWLRAVPFVVHFVQTDILRKKIILSLEFDCRRVNVHITTYIYLSRLLFLLGQISWRIEWNWALFTRSLLMRLIFLSPACWAWFSWTLSDCLSCCLWVVRLQLLNKGREAVVVLLILILLSFVHWTLPIVIINACTPHLVSILEDDWRASLITDKACILWLRSEKWLAELLIFVSLTHLSVWSWLFICNCWPKSHLICSLVIESKLLQQYSLGITWLVFLIHRRR